MLHGRNPYLDPPLSVPADPVFARVTWTESTSAYGPLFTLITYPLAWLPVWLAVAALKAIAAASVLALAVLVSRLAALRGVEPLRAAAFVALNPLVLVHVVGGAHNDGLTMLLAMLAVAAVLYGRELSAGALLLAATAVKASAAFLAPFALLGAAHPTSTPTGPKPHIYGVFGPVGRLLAGGIGALAVVGAAGQLAFGWSWLHGVGLAGENQSRTSHLSLPITFARLTGLDAGAVRLAAAILFALLVLWLLRWTWRGGDWIRAAAWTAFALLLATSWLLPWYLLWPLPLVAISRDRPLQLLTLTLTAYQLGARIPL